MRALPSALIRAIDRQGEGLAVLVLRLGALGDILRTLPAVRLVRRAMPRARIHWVVDQPWRVVIEGHPDLDGLLTMPRRAWRRMSRSPDRWPELLRSFRRFRRELRGLDAGLALDFQANLRSGLVGLLSGAPVRLGYAGHQQKEGNLWLSTHRVEAGDRRTPRLERNLELVRALGIPTGPLPDSDLPLVAAGEAAAAAIRTALHEDGYALITPGASARQAYKKPPPELLAAAIRQLAAAGLAVLVVWGPGEEPDARRAVEASGGAATLAPPTDLATLAALLHRARLLISGDSGPLHLACAVGCPVVGLYGPTDPEVNRPWAVPHRRVHPPGRQYSAVKKRDRRGGFEGLLPRHVEEAVEQLLRETSA